MAIEEKAIRLLLVDDDLGFRDAAGQALRRQGFQLCEAECGERALDLIPKDNPDLVILDLRMSGIDGITTLSLIRRTHPDLPVLILTGTGSPEHALAGSQLGIVDFIQKPVDMKVLGARILELMEKDLTQLGKRTPGGTDGVSTTGPEGEA